MDSTTVESVKELGNSFMDTISGLADALQVPSEHVYAVLVGQAYAQGLIGLVLTVLGVLMVTVGGFLCMKYAMACSVAHADWEDYTHSKNWGHKKEDLVVPDKTSEGYIAHIITFGVTFLLGLPISISNFGKIIKMINPEYYAIKEIMDVFGS